MTKQILVVDDDALMRRSVKANLEQSGYATLTASSGEEAIGQIRLHLPDLVLLDIGLPGIDGLETLRTIRQYAPETLVIFVTARRRELDEIVGLELGADDYITKPFDIDVLLAHIKAVLRRSSPSASSTAADEEVTVGDLRIVPAAHEVYIDDHLLMLPPKEFDLLLTLARDPGRVFSVGELLSLVWGPEWIGEAQTVYVHIRWLRKKIEEDPGRPRRLLTVRGIGYKLAPGDRS
jgi:DNA-binding response OmpR family regulator